MTGTQLEWHEDRTLDGALFGWRAWTKRSRYDIAECGDSDPRNPRWYTKRTDHLLMPPFDGFCPNLDAARAACETDFIALQRADRWLDHMEQNEPPA